MGESDTVSVWQEHSLSCVLARWLHSTVCMHECDRQSEQRQWLFVAVARALDQRWQRPQPLVPFFIRSFH